MTGPHDAISSFLSEWTAAETSGDVAALDACLANDSPVSRLSASFCPSREWVDCHAPGADVSDVRAGGRPAACLRRPGGSRHRTADGRGRIPGPSRSQHSEGDPRADERLGRVAAFTSAINATSTWSATRSEATMMYSSPPPTGAAGSMRPTGTSAPGSRLTPTPGSDV
jgi:hypothetical protein